MPISLALWILKRRREIRMSAARKLLRQFLVPMWYRIVLKILTRRNSSKSSNKRTPLLLRRRRRISRTKERASATLVSRDTMPQNARRACRPKKSTNLIEAHGGTSGYGKLLSIVLSFVIHLIRGLILVQIFMCVLIFLCFLHIRTGGLPPC